MNDEDIEKAEEDFLKNANDKKIIPILSFKSRINFLKNKIKLKDTLNEDFEISDEEGELF